MLQIVFAVLLLAHGSERVHVPSHYLPTAELAAFVPVPADDPPSAAGQLVCSRVREHSGWFALPSIGLDESDESLIGVSDCYRYAVGVALRTTDDERVRAAGLESVMIASQDPSEETLRWAEGLAAGLEASSDPTVRTVHALWWVRRLGMGSPAVAPARPSRALAAAQVSATALSLYRAGDEEGGVALLRALSPMFPGSWRDDPKTDALLTLQPAEPEHMALLADAMGWWRVAEALQETGCRSLSPAERRKVKGSVTCPP